MWVPECRTIVGFPTVKVTKHGTVPYVRYGYLLVSYSNFVHKTDIPHREIFHCINAMTLNQVRGLSRLMSSFDRAHMTSC